MIVKIKKLNENAVIPKFKHIGDGAQDLIATSCTYNPKHDRFEYGLGFATAIPVGYRMKIAPRSSNTKTECYMPNGEGIIDSGYRGEWFVMYKLRTPFSMLFPEGDRELNLLEMENELAPYKVGDAIAQCYSEKIEDTEWKEVDELDDTDRGADGGLVRDDKNFK